MNILVNNTSQSESRHLPRDAFRFCPHCGHEPLGGNHTRAIRCEACGFQYYLNTATASGAFVFYDDKLILCIRARDPGRGKLDVPGGFIEYDETVEQGLQREIREELNLETGDYSYLASAPNDYYYAGVLYKVTDIFFTCMTSTINTLNAADDVADYRLMKPEDVNPDDFAFPSTRLAFRQLLSVRLNRS